MTRSCLKIKDSPLGAPLCRHHKTCGDIHEVIITSDQIHQTIQTLAKQIQAAYANDVSVVVPFLLKGAKPFANDLEDSLNNPKFNFVPVHVSSYQGGTQSTGKLVIENTDMIDISGRPILIVDDIYDSGLTLNRFKAHLEASNPSSIKTCVMFEKDCEHTHEVALDFVGLLVPNDFIVGYGLDYQERYRDLHCVGKLKPNVIMSENHYEDSKSA
jgi:hypoxanthine phosphoribosyltransferase